MESTLTLMKVFGQSRVDKIHLSGRLCGPRLFLAGSRAYSIRSQDQLPLYHYPFRGNHECRQKTSFFSSSELRPFERHVPTLAYLARHIIGLAINKDWRGPGEPVRRHSSLKLARNFFVLSLQLERVESISVVRNQTMKY
jgi:hypothetical protein